MIKKLVCVVIAFAMVVNSSYIFDAFSDEVYAQTITRDEYNALIQKKNSMYPSYKKALIKYNDGSISFFKSIGADDAVKTIKNCKYKSYIKLTSKGDSVKESLKDATSLKNMKKAIEYVISCNKRRKKINLSELKISSVLMAQAQANADYTVKEIKHAEQFDTSENLSWGYDDPIVGWFDDEKVLLDEAIKKGLYPGIEKMGMYEVLEKYPEFFSKVGHYYSITYPDYKTTGFGLRGGCKYGNGIAYSQVYSKNKKYNADAVDADEYQKTFLEYYNGLTKIINEYEALVKKINSYEVAEYGVGKVITKGGIKYKITGKTTANVVGSKKTIKKANVLDTISNNGYTFKVTSIGKKAFKGRKKLKSVTIGSNVKVINKKAFAGCKKLKKVVVKSKILKKVKAKAFKGINKKASFKVSRAKLKKYKKMIKKGGAPKSAKFKC